MASPYWMRWEWTLALTTCWPCSALMKSVSWGARLDWVMCFVFSAQWSQSQKENFFIFIANSCEAFSFLVLSLFFVVFFWEEDVLWFSISKAILFQLQTLCYPCFGGVFFGLFCFVFVFLKGGRSVWEGGGRGRRYFHWFSFLKNPAANFDWVACVVLSVQ